MRGGRKAYKRDKCGPEGLSTMCGNSVVIATSVVRRHSEDRGCSKYYERHQ
jgi:hypothetical protein